MLWKLEPWKMQDFRTAQLIFDRVFSRNRGRVLVELRGGADLQVAHVKSGTSAWHIAFPSIGTFADRTFGFFYFIA